MAAILGFTPAAAAQTADTVVSVAGFDWTILLVVGAVAVVIALIAALVKAVRSRLSAATQTTATVKSPESFIVTEADRFAVKAAQQVAAKIKALLETKETINIIFATGNTMKIFLRELAKIEGIEWSRVKAFHLDEYRGLRADHEASFAYFLNENLFSRVAIPQANVNLVADYVKYDPFQYGWIPQVVKQYILGPVYAAVVLPFYLRAYTAALKAEGGADIVMLGIGANGHLAFNEPSMSEGFTSRIRQIKLTQSTIESNKADYPAIVDVPYAYTMGLADIFEAEHKFMLANGAKKAAIVNTALNGEVTPMVPASGLQVQEHVHVILDNEAANGFGDTIKEGADVITTGATATVKRNGILFKTLASVAVISGLALVTQAYLFGALTAVVGMAVANIVIFGIFMAATDLVGQWIAGHGIIKKQVAYAFPLGIGMGILSWIFFNVIAPETYALPALMASITAFLTLTYVVGDMVSNRTLNVAKVFRIKDFVSTARFTALGSVAVIAIVYAAGKIVPSIFGDSEPTLAASVTTAARIVGIAAMVRLRTFGYTMMVEAIRGKIAKFREEALKSYEKQFEAFWMTRIHSILRSFVIQLPALAPIAVAIDGITTQYFSIFYTAAVNKTGYFVKDAKLRMNKWYQIVVGFVGPFVLAAKGIVKMVKKIGGSSRPDQDSKTPRAGPGGTLGIMIAAVTAALMSERAVAQTAETVASTAAFDPTVLLILAAGIVIGGIVAVIILKLRNRAAAKIEVQEAARVEKTDVREEASVPLSDIERQIVDAIFAIQVEKALRLIEENEKSLPVIISYYMQMLHELTDTLQDAYLAFLNEFRAARLTTPDVYGHQAEDALISLYSSELFERLLRDYLDEESQAQFQAIRDFYRADRYAEHTTRVRTIADRLINDNPMLSVSAVYGLGYPFYGDIDTSVYQFLTLLKVVSSRFVTKLKPYSAKEYVYSALIDVDILVVYEPVEAHETLDNVQPNMVRRMFSNYDREMFNGRVNVVMDALRKMGEDDPDLRIADPRSKLVESFVERGLFHIDVIPYRKHLWNIAPVFIEPTDVKYFLFNRDMLFTVEPLAIAAETNFNKQKLLSDNEVAVPELFRRNLILSMLTKPLTPRQLSRTIVDRQVHRFYVASYEETRAVVLERWETALNRAIREGLIVMNKEGKLEITINGERVLAAVRNMRAEILERGAYGIDYATIEDMVIARRPQEPAGFEHVTLPVDVISVKPTITVEATEVETDKTAGTEAQPATGRMAKLRQLLKRLGLNSFITFISAATLISGMVVSERAHAQDVDTLVTAGASSGVSGLIWAGIGLVLAGVAAYFLSRRYILRGSWDDIVEQYNTRRIEDLKAGREARKLYIPRSAVPQNVLPVIGSANAERRLVPADDVIYFNVDERENAYVVYRWAYTAEAEELVRVHNDAWMATPQETVTIEQLRSAVANNNKGIVVAQVIDKATKRAFVGALIWSVDKYLTPEMIETIRTQPLTNGENGNAGFLSTVRTLTNNFTLQGSVDAGANSRFNFALGAPNVKAVAEARRDYYLVDGAPVKGLAGGLVKTQAAQAEREGITYLATYSPASAQSFHEHNGAVKWSIGELEAGRYEGMNAILMLYTPASELDYVRTREATADVQDVVVVQTTWRNRITVLLATLTGKLRSLLGRSGLILIATVTAAAAAMILEAKEGVMMAMTLPFFGKKKEGEEEDDDVITSREVVVEVRRLDEVLEQRLTRLNRQPVEVSVATHEDYVRAAMAVADELKAQWDYEFNWIWTDMARLPIQVKTVLSTKRLDRIVRRVYEYAIARFGDRAEDIMFVAHGSNARREFVPGSDVDLRLEVKNMEEQEDVVQFIQEVIYRTFNHNITLVPTSEQLKWNSTKSSDIDTASSVLESRFVAGDRDIWTAWRKDIIGSLKAAYEADPQVFIHMKRQEWQERYAKNGFREGMNVKEPDLKSGNGSLRDLQVIYTIGLAEYFAEYDDIDSLARRAFISHREIWTFLVERGLLDQTQLRALIKAYLLLLRTRALTGQLNESKENSKVVLENYLPVATQLGYRGDDQTRIRAFLRDLRKAQDLLFRFTLRKLRYLHSDLEEYRADQYSTAEGLPEGMVLINRTGTYLLLENGFQHRENQRTIALRDPADQRVYLTRIFDILTHVAVHYPVALRGVLYDRLEGDMEQLSWWQWAKLRFRFAGQYLKVSAPLSAGLWRLRYLADKAGNNMLSRLIYGFGELMYRRHLDPPHHLTLDHYTMATFVRAEALMFNNPSMVHDMDRDEFRAMRDRLVPMIRHLHERNLLRVLRLAMLLHTNGHVTPAVKRTVTRIFGRTAAAVLDRIVKRAEITLAMAAMGVLPFSRDARLVTWLVMNQNALIDRIRKGDNPADMQAFFADVIDNDPAKFALITVFTLVQHSVLQPQGIRQRLEDFYPVLEIDFTRLSDAAYVAATLRNLQAQHTEQYMSGVMIDYITDHKVNITVNNTTSRAPERGKMEEILVYINPEMGDRPGILNRIAAVLIAYGFARRNYRVGLGPEGRIVDHFFVEHRFGTKVEWVELLEAMRVDIERMINEEARPQDIIRERIESEIEGETETERRNRLNIAEELFEVPQNDIATTITMSAATYRGEKGTLLEVSTVNYSGWLYVLSSILMQLGINIHGGTGEVIGDQDIGQISYDTLLLHKDGKPLSAEMQRRLENKIADITRKQRVTARDWQAPDAAKLYTHPLSVIIAGLFAAAQFNIAVPDVLLALATLGIAVILTGWVIKAVGAGLKKFTQWASTATTRGPPAGSKTALVIAVLAALLTPDTAYGFTDIAVEIGQQGLFNMIMGAGAAMVAIGGVGISNIKKGEKAVEGVEVVKSNPYGALAAGAPAGAPEPPRKKKWWERLLAFLKSLFVSRTVETERVIEDSKRVHSLMVRERRNARGAIDRLDPTIFSRNKRGSDEPSVRNAPTDTKSAELLNKHDVRVSEEAERMIQDKAKASELLAKAIKTPFEKEVVELYEFLMEAKRDMEKTPIDRGGVQNYDLANDRIKQIHAAKVFLRTAKAFLEGRGEFNIISADTGIGKSDLAAAIARWMYRRTNGKVIILMNVPDAKVYDFLTHPLLIDLVKEGGLRRVKDGDTFRLEEGINVGDFKDSKELISRKILNAERGRRVFEINDESDAFERSPDLIKGERRLEELQERSRDGDAEATAELERLAKLETVDRIKYEILDRMLHEADGRMELLVDADKHGRPILRSEYLMEGEALSPLARFYRDYLRALKEARFEGKEIIDESRKDITKQVNAFIEAMYSRDNPNHGRDDSELGIHMLTNNKFSQPGTIPGDANLARAIIIMEGLSSRNFKVAALSKVENAVKAADVHRLVGGVIGMTATAESMRQSAELQGAKIFRHGKEDGLPESLKIEFDRTPASYRRPGDPIVDILLREVTSDVFNTEDARVTLTSLWNALAFRLLRERLTATVRAEKGTDNVFRIKDIRLSDGTVVSFPREKMVVIVGEDAKIKGQPDPVQEARAKELIRRAQNEPDLEVLAIQLGLSGGSNILKAIEGEARTKANTLFIGSTATAEAIQFTSRANLPGKKVARIDLNEAKLLIAVYNDPNLSPVMRRDVIRAIDAGDVAMQRYLAEKILSTLEVRSQIHSMVSAAKSQAGDVTQKELNQKINQLIQESTERLIVEHMNRTHVDTMNVSLDSGSGFETFVASAFETNETGEEIVVAANAVSMTADNPNKVIELNLGGNLTYGQRLEYGTNLIYVDASINPKRYFGEAPVSVTFIEQNERSGNFKRRIEDIHDGHIYYTEQFKYIYTDGGSEKRTYVKFNIVKSVDEHGDLKLVEQELAQTVTIAGTQYVRGSKARFFDNTEKDYRDLMHSFSVLGDDLVIHENRAIKADKKRRFKLEVEQAYTSQLKVVGIVYRIGKDGKPVKAFVDVEASPVALKLIGFRHAKFLGEEIKSAKTRDGLVKYKRVTVRVANREFEKRLELDDKRANDNKFVGYFQKWNLFMQKLRGAAVKISDIDPTDPTYASYRRAARLNIERIEKILENRGRMTEAFADLMQDLLNMMNEALDPTDSSIDILALVELGAQETIGMLDEFKRDQRRMFDRRVYQQIVTRIAPYFGEDFNAAKDQRMIRRVIERDAQPGEAQFTGAEAVMKRRLDMLTQAVENLDPARPYSQNVYKVISEVLMTNGFDINFAGIRDLDVFKGMSITQRIIFEHLLKNAFPAGFADEDNNNVILTRASDLNDGFLKDLGRNPEAMQGDQYSDERRAEAMLHELIGLHLVGGPTKTRGQIQRRTDAQNIIIQRKMHKLNSIVAEDAPYHDPQIEAVSNPFVGQLMPSLYRATTTQQPIPGIIHLGLYYDVAPDGLISVEQENLRLGDAEILYSTFAPSDESTYYTDELVNYGISADTHTVLATHAQVEQLREMGIDFEALDIELEDTGREQPVLTAEQLEHFKDMGVDVTEMGIDPETGRRLDARDIERPEEEREYIFTIKHAAVAHLIDPNFAYVESHRLAEATEKQADESMLAMLNIREIIRVIGDANGAMILPPDDKAAEMVHIMPSINVPFMLPQVDGDEEQYVMIYINISDLFMDNSLLDILINYLRRLLGQLWDIAEHKIEEYKIAEGIYEAAGQTGYTAAPIRVSVTVEPIEVQPVSASAAVIADTAVASDNVGAVFYAITTTGDTDEAQLSELKLTRGVPELTDEDAAWRSFYDKKVEEKDMRYVEQLAQRFALDQRAEWQQFKQDRMDNAAWTIVFDMLKNADTGNAVQDEGISEPETLSIPARTIEHEAVNGTEVLVEERGGYVSLRLPELTVDEILDTPGVSGDVLLIGKSIDVPLTIVDLDQKHSQTAQVYILEDKWISHKTLWDLLLELLSRLLGGLWERMIDAVNSEETGVPPHVKYAELIAQRVEEYEIQLAEVTVAVEKAQEQSQAAVFYATTTTGDTTVGSGDVAMLARTLELTKGLPETFESDAEQTAAWRNFYDKKVAEGDQRYIDQLAQRFVHDERSEWQHYREDRRDHGDWKVVFVLINQLPEAKHHQTAKETISTEMAKEKALTERPAVGKKSAVFYAMTYTGDSAEGQTDAAVLAKTLDLTKGVPETFESDDNRVAAWRDFYDRKVIQGDERYIRQLARRFESDEREEWQLFRQQRENNPEWQVVFVLMSKREEVKHHQDPKVSLQSEHEREETFETKVTRTAKNAVFYAMTYTGDSAEGQTDVAVLAKNLDLTKGVPETFETSEERIAAWRDFYDRMVAKGDKRYVEQVAQRFLLDEREEWQLFRQQRENNPEWEVVFVLMNKLQPEGHHQDPEVSLQSQHEREETFETKVTRIKRNAVFYAMTYTGDSAQGDDFVAVLAKNLDLTKGVPETFETSEERVAAWRDFYDRMVAKGDKRYVEQLAQRFILDPRDEWQQLRQARKHDPEWQVVFVLMNKLQPEGHHQDREVSLQSQQERKETFATKVTRIKRNAVFYAMTYTGDETTGDDTVAVLAQALDLTKGVPETFETSEERVAAWREFYDRMAAKGDRRYIEQLAQRFILDDRDEWQLFRQQRENNPEWQVVFILMHKLEEVGHHQDPEVSLQSQQERKETFVAKVTRIKRHAVFFAMTYTGDSTTGTGDAALLAQALDLTKGVPETFETGVERVAAWREFYDRKVREGDPDYITQIAKRFLLDQRDAWQQFRRDRASAPAYREVFALIRSIETPERPVVTPEVAEVIVPAVKPHKPWISDVYEISYFQDEEVNPYRALVHVPHIEWPPLKTFEILGPPIIDRDILMIGEVVDVPVRMPVFERPRERRNPFAVLVEAAAFVENQLDLFVDYLFALTVSIWNRLGDILTFKRIIDHREKTVDQAVQEVEHLRYDLPINAIRPEIVPVEPAVDNLDDYGLDTAEIEVPAIEVQLPAPVFTTAARVLSPFKIDPVSGVVVEETEDKTAVFFAMTYTGDSTAGLTDVALLAKELDLTKGVPETFETDEERVAAWRDFYDKKVEEGDATYIRQIAERFRRDSRPEWQRFRWAREHHPAFQPVFEILAHTAESKDMPAISSRKPGILPEFNLTETKKPVFTQNFKDRPKSKYDEKDAAKIVEATLKAESDSIAAVKRTRQLRPVNRPQVRQLTIKERLAQARILQDAFSKYKRRHPDAQLTDDVRRIIERQMRRNNRRNKQTAVIAAAKTSRRAVPRSARKRSNWKKVSGKFRVIQIDNGVISDRGPFRRQRPQTRTVQKSTYQKPVYSRKQRDKVVDATLALEETRVNKTREPRFQRRRPVMVLRDGQLISDNRQEVLRAQRKRPASVTGIDRDRVIDATLYLEDKGVVKNEDQTSRLDQATQRQQIREQSISETLRSEEEKIYGKRFVNQRSRGDATGGQAEQPSGIENLRDAALLAQPGYDSKRLVLPKRALPSELTEKERARKSADAAVLVEELRAASRQPSIYERLKAAGAEVRTLSRETIIIEAPQAPQYDPDEPSVDLAREIDNALLLEEMKLAQAAGEVTVTEAAELSDVVDRVEPRQTKSTVLDFYQLNPPVRRRREQDARTRRDDAFIAELEMDRILDNIRFYPERAEELAWDFVERTVVEDYFINPFEAARVMVGGRGLAEDEEGSAYNAAELLEPEEVLPYRSLSRDMNLMDLVRLRLHERIRFSPDFPGKAPLLTAMSVPEYPFLRAPLPVPDSIAEQELLASYLRLYYERYWYLPRIGDLRFQFFLPDTLKFGIFVVEYDPRLYPGSDFPAWVPVNLHVVYKPLKLPDVVILEVPPRPVNKLVILPIEDVDPVPITALPDYEFVRKRLKLLEQYLPPEPVTRIPSGPEVKTGALTGDKEIGEVAHAVADRTLDVRRLRFLQEYLTPPPVIPGEPGPRIDVRIYPLDKFVAIPLTAIPDYAFVLERLKLLEQYLPPEPVTRIPSSPAVSGLTVRVDAGLSAGLTARQDYEYILQRLYALEQQVTPGIAERDRVDGDRSPAGPGGRLPRPVLPLPDPLTGVGPAPVVYPAIIPVEDSVEVPLTALPDYEFVLERLRLLEQYLPPEPVQQIPPRPEVEVRIIPYRETVEVPITALPDYEFIRKRMDLLEQYLPPEPVVRVPERPKIENRKLRFLHDYLPASAAVTVTPGPVIDTRIVPLRKFVKVPVTAIPDYAFVLDRLQMLEQYLPPDLDIDAESGKQPDRRSVSLDGFGLVRRADVADDGPVWEQLRLLEQNLLPTTRVRDAERNAVFFTMNYAGDSSQGKSDVAVLAKILYLTKGVPEPYDSQDKRVAAWRDFYDRAVRRGEERYMKQLAQRFLIDSRPEWQQFMRDRARDPEWQAVFRLVDKLAKVRQYQDSRFMLDTLRTQVAGHGSAEGRTEAGRPHFLRYQLPPEPGPDVPVRPRVAAGIIPMEGIFQVPITALPDYDFIRKRLKLLAKYMTRDFVVPIPPRPQVEIHIIPFSEFVEVPITGLPDYKFVLERMRMLAQYLPPEPVTEVPPRLKVDIRPPRIEKSIHVPLRSITGRKNETKRLRFLEQYLPPEPVTEVPPRPKVDGLIIPIEKSIDVPIIPFEDKDMFLERIRGLEQYLPLPPVTPVTPPVIVPTGARIEPKRPQQESSIEGRDKVFQESSREDLPAEPVRLESFIIEIPVGEVLQESSREMEIREGTHQESRATIDPRHPLVPPPALVESQERRRLPGDRQVPNPKPAVRFESTRTESTRETILLESFRTQFPWQERDRDNLSTNEPSERVLQQSLLEEQPRAQVPPLSLRSGAAHQRLYRQRADEVNRERDRLYKRSVDPERPAELFQSRLKWHLPPVGLDIYRQDDPRERILLESYLRRAIWQRLLQQTKRRGYPRHRLLLRTRLESERFDQATLETAINRPDPAEEIVRQPQSQDDLVRRGALRQAPPRYLDFEPVFAEPRERILLESFLRDNYHQRLL